MSKGQIILLHGILRSRIDMLPLAHFLEKRGYKTLNILYPSRSKSLEELEAFIHDKILNLAKEIDKPNDGLEIKEENGETSIIINSETKLNF